ncbi:MAG: K(+)-transporting ATPase subunit C [Cloacibacillus sp.]
MGYGIFKKAAGFLLLMTVICGPLYMLTVTAAAQALFPHQANGSVIEINGKRYGSELLGQPFSDPGHLWGRAMNVDLKNYKAADGRAVMYAAPSNISPASKNYEKSIAERAAKMTAAHAGAAPVPVELVTISGSGLDPEISPSAAQYQTARIAAHRGIEEKEVRAVIKKYTTGRFLGLFGEPRVNVLKVNLALDGVL